MLTVPKTLKHFDLPSLVDQEIVSYGRIYRIGKRSKFWFLKIRTADCSNDTTLIVNKNILPKPTTYSTVAFKGLVQRSPDGKVCEIMASEIIFYGPFEPQDVQVEFGMAPHLLRQKESQRLLTRQYQAIMWLYQKTEDALHSVSRDLGLLRIRAPFITFSDCEGGGEVFEVHSKIKGFFKKPAFLTVSGQVDEETVTSRFLCPTYIFGPSFRSDPSQTQFHACEFYHYEPEIPFITLDGLMDLEENTLKKTIGKLLADEESREFLGHLERDLDSLQQFVDRSFARVTYTEAVKILQTCNKQFERAVEWGTDLCKEHERYLCDEFFGSPTFVYQYPSSFKSFYMLQCDVIETDTQTGQHKLQVCESVDLLVPGIGELCGGSLREHRYDVLVEMMKKKGLKLEDYEDYLRLRREGTFPHGGYGLGFDRLVMFITGAQSIRDICPFPRYYNG